MTTIVPSAREPREELIHRVLSYPMDQVIARYAEDWEFTLDEAREHERELKRFLALRVLNPERGYGMCGKIDEVWHTLILFTETYHRFCEYVAGEYIHHRPFLADDGGSGSAYASWHHRYLQFLADYEATFGGV
jgi:hypothetical protein